MSLITMRPRRRLREQPLIGAVVWKLMKHPQTPLCSLASLAGRRSPFDVETGTPVPLSAATPPYGLSAAEESRKAISEPLHDRVNRETASLTLRPYQCNLRLPLTRATTRLQASDKATFNFLTLRLTSTIKPRRALLEAYDARSSRKSTQTDKRDTSRVVSLLLYVADV